MSHDIEEDCLLPVRSEEAEYPSEEPQSFPFPLTSTKYRDLHTKELDKLVYCGHFRESADAPYLITPKRIGEKFSAAIQSIVDCNLASIVGTGRENRFDPRWRRQVNIRPLI